ncbi:carotenoid isomerooxygenase isoform X2 [Orussus abietinus]|uniref:carotenoid isomerooxygenase isoform X2 n=1 Tax=Orussus abietinus TaxID=222816 RepID=UPI000625E79B|nr:carotenoid isomerooxygenase isoform X2 [Orussus abietinus]
MKRSRILRSKSEIDFSRKVNVIDELLGLDVNHLRTSRTMTFGREGEGSKTLIGHSQEDDDDDDDDRGDDRGDKVFWPNCDSTIWMRSCEREVIDPIKGKVTGAIPKWLRGILLRNGPGSLKVGEYRFEIADGGVTYQNRFVETDVFRKNHEAKRIVVTDFGTKAVPDPCRSIFQRVASAFSLVNDTSDNSMISVYPFGDEFYTFTESPVIHRIDPKTLETKKKVILSDYVNIVNHTSHPHVLSDGTVYNVGMRITPRGPAYSVVCFAPNRLAIDHPGEAKELSMFDQATIVASVPARRVLNPSYMHTFGITDNYFVIIEQPLSVALVRLVSCKIRDEPMYSCLKWSEEDKTLIHVVSKNTGRVEKTFRTEAFFFLHIINQFETRDRDHIVLDICCYRDAKMLDCMYIDAMKNMHSNPDYSKMFRGRPLRFILPMKTPNPEVSPEENLIGVKTGHRSYHDTKMDPKVDQVLDPFEENETEAEPSDVLKREPSAHRLESGETFVKPELLCDLGCETPRINYELYLGREYRYFYAISSDVDGENPGSIIKVDTMTKTRKVWFEKNIFPSEPIFVPDPHGKSEDDGIVVSSLVWGQERENEVGLLILNAQNLQEMARATFSTPGPVPKCLHGWFSLNK